MDDSGLDTDILLSGILVGLALLGITVAIWRVIRHPEEADELSWDSHAAQAAASKRIRAEIEPQYARAIQQSHGLRRLILIWQRERKIARHASQIIQGAQS